MDRPYIICHMTMSVDGKVTGDFLSHDQCSAGIEDYYRINRGFGADAFACGRITMEGSFTGGYTPDLSQFGAVKVERTDYIAESNAGFFAVSFDRRARLGWQTPFIIDDDPGYGGAHIIEVVCEDANDEMLAYYRSIGVSYIFAGGHELDLSLALKKLNDLFSINKLLLEGGSEINGTFFKAGVIDELSLVVVPVTADDGDKPLFYRGSQKAFRVISAEAMQSGAVWLRYEK